MIPTGYIPRPSFCVSANNYEYLLYILKILYTIMQETNSLLEKRCLFKWLSISGTNLNIQVLKELQMNHIILSDTDINDTITKVLETSRLPSQVVLLFVLKFRILKSDILVTSYLEFTRPLQFKPTQHNSKNIIVSQLLVHNDFQVI